MAIFILTSAVLVPSLDRVSPKHLKRSTSSFSPFMVMACAGVGRAVHHDLRLSLADFNSVCSCSFNESAGEILTFIAGANHEVNIINESQSGDGSSTDTDRGVVIMESLMHYFLKENVEQDGREQTYLYPLPTTASLNHPQKGFHDEFFPHKKCVQVGNRTRDPRICSQALYQLIFQKV
ncbi:hypothetical protein DPMN_122262 [Dreissena polymorpha]|uniref:Uncharacterized protein n=1 Tax=Dreissena polymorpha TaxID=45954 RepID=A0A9D4JTZ6_DREPO|nr:hypothetical protein DPMN_122262 [Dreissena polymorpha]